jgi:ketopantoate hydroxymethyltransferase
VIIIQSFIVIAASITADKIVAVVKSGIPSPGHTGLMPRSISVFKVQGIFNEAAGCGFLENYGIFLTAGRR